MPIINEPCSVWAFSRDYYQLEKLNAKLPPEWSNQNIGDLLNKIARQIKDNFINIDEQISTGRFYDSFLASSMGERNPYQNDFFLNLCRALSLKDIAKMKGHHIILIDDIELGNALLKTCLLGAISAEWATPATKPIFEYFWKRCRAFASGLYTAITNWSLGQKIKRSRKTGVKPNPIWLMNWMDKKTFSANKMAQSDTFYGNLHVEIEGFPQSITWLANPMSSIIPENKIVEDINNSKNNVICIYEFITLRTIFRSIFGWLMFPLSIRSELIINGDILSPIVAYTSSQERTNPQIITALLYADIAPKLAKQNIQPKIFIYPFENQPWDKILLQNFRKFCSSTKIIGMQHAPFADNYVSSIPSLKQWQQNIAPDLLVTIGTEFYERLIKESAPKDKLKIGGYYRNPKLTAVPGKKIRQRSINNTAILVSCPMNQQDSIELIQKSADATTTMKNTQIIVNFHPMFSKKIKHEILKRADETENFGHLEFVEGSAQTLLEKCSMLIYNSSGTVFEAARLGIPSIYVGSDSGLDLNKVPGGSNLKCRSSEDLNRIIIRLSTDALFLEKVVNQAQNSLKYCFSQPRPETWANIISLNSSVKQI